MDYYGENCFSSSTHCALYSAYFKGKTCLMALMINRHLIKGEKY